MSIDGFLDLQDYEGLIQSEPVVLSGEGLHSHLKGVEEVNRGYGEARDWDFLPLRDEILDTIAFLTGKSPNRSLLSVFVETSSATLAEAATQVGHDLQAVEMRLDALCAHGVLVTAELNGLFTYRLASR